MGQIGEELRIHREAKGISLREVEEVTKIRMKYLIALEADDFDVLPGKVYVIGFLRTYARFLGIDDEELVSSLKSSPPFEVNQEEIQEKTRPASKNKNTKPAFLILAIVLALIIGGISIAYFLNHDEPSNNPVPQTDIPQEPKEGQQEPPVNTPNPAETDDSADLENAPETNGVSVTVIVREDICWIDVKIDRKNDFKGTLKAGESRTFTGQEIINIKYGNPGVVEVIHNGASTYPVGNIGQVINREYKEKE